jgi:hypothetical protein
MSAARQATGRRRTETSGRVITAGLVTRVAASAPAIAAGLVAWVATSASAIARAEEPSNGVITLNERVPAVMIVLTPRDFVSRTPTSEFLDAARRVVRARTRLALASAEQAGVDAGALARCGATERLGCWLIAARPDALALPSETAAKGAADRPRYLFVLSVLPATEVGEDRLSLYFVDADEAIARWRRVSRFDEDWRERAESELDAISKSSPPRDVRASDPRALRDHLERVIDEEVRPTLERAGDWDPYGRIEVKTKRAGLPIAVDGVELGVTAAETTTLVDVGPGRRRVTVGAAGAAATLEVDVTRGAVAIARFDGLLARLDLSDRTPVLRYSVLGAGAALGVAGGALAILGASRTGDVRQGCVLREGDVDAECRGLGTPALGWDPSGAPAIDADAINPSGVAMLPLGLALVGAGATLATGTFLVDDDADGDDWLWLPAVAGLALGALVYGTGAALGSR